MSENEQKLKAVLEALVAKLEVALPALDNLAVLAHIHGADYTGPTFGQEVVDARQLLTELK